MTIQELIEKIKDNDRILVMMVGVPLSGKSTFVDKIKDHGILISRDDMIMEHGKGISYKEAYDIADGNMIDKQLKKIMVEAGQTSNNYIIDMTNLTVGGRWKSIAKFPKHIKIVVCLEIPSKEELVRRNIKRDKDMNKYIPERVLDNMINSYIEPTLGEGLDYIIKIEQ